jgi:NAD(P)-dependent dehydrogenase (short-subunit alcohol dehydrogenase family)
VDISGRVALLAGAARGLGFEAARQLATAGTHVLVSARRHEAAAEAAGKLTSAGEVRALRVDLDVTDPEAAMATAAAIGADPGRLDILINNAAAYVDWSEVASSADLKLAEQVIATNLFGAWRLTQALLPLLRESEHPRIVNVSSGAGSHADPEFGLTRRAGAAATYGISKAALNALTSTLAAELSNTAILVNAVCPGLTATWPGAEQMGARPIPDGAASIVWGAGIPDAGPTGGFFRDGKPLGW